MGGWKCFVLYNGKDRLGKLDSKSDKAIFVGFSSTSKLYNVYNKRTLCVKESVHVIFDESENMKNPTSTDDTDIEELIPI